VPLYAAPRHIKSSRYPPDYRGDVLLVSGEIGECNFLFVDDVKESGRPAAMMDIRLSIVVRRREEDARL
jgi:hypothetical protein